MYRAIIKAKRITGYSKQDFVYCSREVINRGKLQSRVNQIFKKRGYDLENYKIIIYKCYSGV
ncbi:hypothetical protein LCGC14_1519860 [marine sediment metagenome]|uniref:Uncharacterized protein n=1 Tax=marine sediment metagenome TaxID=412755 RepID=A0A0F9M014_9ZZZZ